MSVPSLAEVVEHLIWPVSCPVCGAVGKILCDECLRRLLNPPLPRCLWCGKVIPCVLHAGEAKIRAAALYDGHIRDLILMLKHGGYQVMGVQIGAAMATVLPRPAADALLPVPLHLKSRRRYNQAAAIAEGLSAVWGIEVCDAAVWTADIASRAGMGTAERLALDAGAFAFTGDVRGLRLSIVDDVCTTGTTIVRLAESCRAAGGFLADAFVIASASQGN